LEYTEADVTRKGSEQEPSRISDLAGSVRAAATRGRVSLLGTVLVLVVGGFVAVRTVDTGQLADAIRNADPLLLGAGAVVYALSWPLRGHRYDDILAAMGGRCGTVFTTSAVFVSQTANLVVPARGGDALRAYLLNSRRGVPYSKGAASLTVERLFDLLALLALGSLALAGLVLAGDAGDLAGAADFLLPAAIVGGAGVAVSALVVGVAKYDPRTGAWLRGRIDGPRTRKLVDAAVRFGRDVRRLATDPRALGVVGTGSLLIWLLDVATAVLVLAAVTGSAGMGTVAFLAVGTLAVTVGNLAKVLPLSQGGIGLYEAAFTALVVAASPIAAGPALAAAVLDHALKNATTLLGGAASALALNVSPTTAPAEPETEPVDF